MLQRLLSALIGAIDDPSILDRYAEIDAYSQGRNPSKNDVWIAATAAALNDTLLTIDRDFAHLDGVYPKVEYIDQTLTEDDV